jgi:hypothetical protein
LPELRIYILESSYEPTIHILNEYKDREEGVRKICGAWGPVEHECNNCPEGVSIYSPSNENDQKILPPIDVTHHETVMLIVDYMKRSTLSKGPSKGS